MYAEKTEMPWGFWIRTDSQILAGVVRASFIPNGAEFVSPVSQSLQVAIMRRETAYEIPAHEHLPVGRALEGTQEVLVIRSGILRADLYEAKAYVGSVQVGAGDVLILVGGGHGFVASEDCTFIEVKQGPYVESRDKEVFPSVISSGIPLRKLD